MRKISLIIMCAAVIISCISLYISFKDDNEVQNTAVITTTEENKTEICYYLKEYNGKIAVFEEGSDLPYKEFDVSVNTLSDYDKELLKNGIRAENSEKIRQLIEDYTG